MKAQGILALVALTIGFGQSAPVFAQALPPMAGPPVYDAQGAYPVGPPRYASRFGSLYDDALLPQEIVGILESTGYSPLGLPIRHGRFYVVSVLHPNGDDGRVTLDAFSGRFVRFVPADQVGAIRDESVAVYPPPPPAAAPRPVMPPPAAQGLRPPAPLPKIASRVPATTPIPAPKPASLAKQSGEQAPAAAVPPSQKTADSGQAAGKAADVKPADSKPQLQLLPTQPSPPVQTLE